MNDAITINVNNKDYTVENGQTIMKALDKIGYHIPRLCYHPKLSVEGACRICIVEVEGSANYVTSCTAKVAEGMKIKTNSAELRKARRDILELLLDSHPVDCNTCERDGNCELQSIARSVGIKKKHFEGERKVQRNIEYYNLDVILSVGYRVKSKQGIHFRIWANRILTNHLLEEYTSQ